MELTANCVLLERRPTPEREQLEFKLRFKDQKLAAIIYLPRGDEG